jgi:hypothetical protein
MDHVNGRIKHFCMTYKHLLSETVPVVRDSGKLAAQVEFVRWKLEKAEENSRSILMFL